MRPRTAATRTAAALAALVALAGCASPRSTLGTGSSACFKDIPAAVSAVNHKGTLVGVRDVKASSLAARRPELARLGSESLCLVAFQGDYQPGDVPAAIDRTTAGKYAIVAVSSDLSQPKVEAAWISQQLPIRFRHPI